MSKRHRSASEAAQRCVIDVGGTKLSTTVATIERSSYLFGMIDSSCWDSDPGHVTEIFLDRDPEIFSQLLRLMRQTPHVAGLMPTDPRACASVIAEADFFGFDALLCHVKQVVYYNTREAKEDYPEFDYGTITRQPEETAVSFFHRSQEGRKSHDAACKAIDKLFAAHDSEHAQAQFDKVYGSIGDALSAGVLPQFFLNTKPSVLKPFTKIVQLMPVDKTTWFLVGDTEDRTAHPDPDVGEGYETMVPLSTVFTQPALVRRVSHYALVEDETGKRWVEAMVHISIEDQETWMSSQPWDGNGLVLGATVDGPLPAFTQNNGQRTVLASEWVKNYVTANPVWQVHHRDVWSHVLVADVPPPEHGFRKAGY
jgi:hypothetical protein